MSDKLTLNKFLTHAGWCSGSAFTPCDCGRDESAAELAAIVAERDALKAALERVETLVAKWQEPNVHDDGCSEGDHAHDCICGGWYECASELFAALSAKGEPK